VSCENLAPVGTLRLSDLLTERTIRFHQRAAGWREAVRLAGDLLVQQGSVTASYVEAMIRVVEEIGPYMVLAPGIAMAHARPEDGVLRACMSLVHLDSGVEFGSEANDPVDLVFAFGAVDREQHLEALRGLASLMQSEEGVTAIRHCRTAREAARVVKRYSKLTKNV
jgi:mannitol/fructose-specific phosphotransferase system IIA component (Ntr-type)